MRSNSFSNLPIQGPINIPWGKLISKVNESKVNFRIKVIRSKEDEYLYLNLRDLNLNHLYFDIQGLQFSRDFTPKEDIRLFDPNVKTLRKIWHDVSYKNSMMIIDKQLDKNVNLDETVRFILLECFKDYSEAGSVCSIRLLKTPSQLLEISKDNLDTGKDNKYVLIDLLFLDSFLMHGSELYDLCKALIANLGPKYSNTSLDRITFLKESNKFQLVSSEVIFNLSDVFNFTRVIENFEYEEGVLKVRVSDRVSDFRDNRSSVETSKLEIHHDDPYIGNLLSDEYFKTNIESGIESLKLRVHYIVWYYSLRDIKPLVHLFTKFPIEDINKAFEGYKP